MRIIVLDTETLGLNDQRVYDLGYLVFDTETEEVLCKRSYVIKQVFDKAYVKTNVKSKNMNVALPKLFIKTLLKPKVSINPSAKIHKMLGQSIPIVSHKTIEATKIDKTPIASCDNPPKEGIKRPQNAIKVQTEIIVILKIVLSFNFIINFQSFFLIYHLFLKEFLYL